jgi:hypothetical protein
MTGGFAKPPTVAGIRARYPALPQRLPALRDSLETGSPPLSYTQWEAYLVVYHRKRLFLCIPEPSAPRGPAYQGDETQRAQQKAHLERLRALGRYAEISFANPMEGVPSGLATRVSTPGRVRSSRPWARERGASASKPGLTLMSVTPVSYARPP